MLAVLDKGVKGEQAFFTEHGNFSRTGTLPLASQSPMLKSRTGEPWVEELHEWFGGGGGRGPFPTTIGGKR